MAGRGRAGRAAWPTPRNQIEINCCLATPFSSLQLQSKNRKNSSRIGHYRIPCDSVSSPRRPDKPGNEEYKMRTVLGSPSPSLRFGPSSSLFVPPPKLIHPLRRRQRRFRRLHLHQGGSVIYDIHCFLIVKNSFASICNIFSFFA